MTATMPYSQKPTSEEEATNTNLHPLNTVTSLMTYKDRPVMVYGHGLMPKFTITKISFSKLVFSAL